MLPELYQHFNFPIAITASVNPIVEEKKHLKQNDVLNISEMVKAFNKTFRLMS